MLQLFKNNPLYRKTESRFLVPFENLFFYVKLIFFSFVLLFVLPHTMYFLLFKYI